MKKALVFLLMVTVFALSGCGPTVGAVNGSGSRVENISAAEAKQAALSDSGTNEADVKNISTELKMKDGREYYEVDFITDSEEVSYDVDALTGAILGSKHEKKDVTEAAPAETPEQAPAQTPSQTQTGNQAQTQTGNQAQIQDLAQTQTQAPAKTQTQPSNNAASGSTNTTPQKEYANGRQDNQPQLVPATDSVLSEAKVKELILARIPGATNANFVEFHKDYDDGRMEYEGKVIYDNMEYEFEIDAYSGAFRDWDVEFAWD